MKYGNKFLRICLLNIDNNDHKDKGDKGNSDKENKKGKYVQQEPNGIKLNNSIAVFFPRYSDDQVQQEWIVTAHFNPNPNSVGYFKLSGYKKILLIRFFRISSIGPNDNLYLKSIIHSDFFDLIENDEKYICYVYFNDLEEDMQARAIMLNTIDRMSKMYREYIRQAILDINAPIYAIVDNIILPFLFPSSSDFPHKVRLKMNKYEQVEDGFM